MCVAQCISRARRVPAQLTKPHEGRNERFCRAASCPPDLAPMLSRNPPMARGPHPPAPPLQSTKQSETRWDSPGVNSSEPCMDFFFFFKSVT